MIECEQKESIVTIIRKKGKQSDGGGYVPYLGYPGDTVFQNEVMAALWFWLPGPIAASVQGKLPHRILVGYPSDSHAEAYHPSRLDVLGRVFGEYKLIEFANGTAHLTPKKMSILLSILRGDDWHMDVVKRKFGTEVKKVHLVADWKDPLWK
jgi:hypothetical protein